MSKEIVPVEYAEQGLSSIFGAGFLVEEDAKKLLDIQDGIVDTWKKTKIWRSETDMRYSVLQDSKFATKGHKYLQSQVEQDVHFRELMYLSTDYEEKQGELMVLEAELEELQNNEQSKKNDGEVIKKQAQIKRAKWNLLEMQKAAHHRVREVTLWEKLKKELNDGSFDPDDYEGILKEGYQKRFTAQLHAEMMSGNPSGNRVSVLKGSLSALQHGNYNKIGETTKE